MAVRNGGDPGDTRDDEAFALAGSDDGPKFGMSLVGCAGGDVSWLVRGCSFGSAKATGLVRPCARLFGMARACGWPVTCVDYQDEAVFPKS